MNEYTTAKIDGYENSKCLWDFKNVFSFPDAWYLSILNYPSATEHLMLIRIHTSSKKFFIYDPVADRGQKESEGSYLIVYIDLVACIFVSRYFYYG